MKTIEAIAEEIQNQAKEAFIRQCSGRNYHSLILTGQGKLYWTEETCCHSVSEQVWSGQDCRVMGFQGWCPDNDFEYFEMIEATAKELDEIAANKIEGESECNIGGETFRVGESDYGYDPGKWYKTGDLLTEEPDMWLNMEQAIEEAQEFYQSQHPSKQKT